MRPLTDLNLTSVSMCKSTRARHGLWSKLSLSMLLQRCALHEHRCVAAMQAIKTKSVRSDYLLGRDASSVPKYIQCSPCTRFTRPSMFSEATAGQRPHRCSGLRARTKPLLGITTVLNMRGWGQCVQVQGWG